MTWLWLTLGAIFFFVFSTYVDKYLLNKYFTGRQPGVLILFSCLFAIVVVPVIYLIEPASLAIAPQAAFWLVVGGLLNITAIILYLYAMHLDEVSVVAPLFQLGPVFNYLIGLFFLGEVLTQSQTIGFMLVLIGALLATLDLTQRLPRLKVKLFTLMAVATLLLAINTAIFKVIALEETFWVSQFWEYLALIIAGSILLVGVKKYREQFFGVFKKNSIPIVALNLMNETTGVLGYWLISYATLLAPIALVSVVSGTQPLFLFFFGAFFTIFFPAFAEEKLTRKVVLQKIISALIIFGGGYLLNIVK